MATIYLMAEEPVPDRQQQDCRLIVRAEAPQGTPGPDLLGAVENAVREKFQSGLTLKETTEQAAQQYVESDPTADTGSFELNPGSLEWHLVRVK